MIRITVDLFSGRPNPVLHLREERARDLLAEIREARLAVPPDELPSVLGYRGLLVESGDAKSNGRPGTPSQLALPAGGRNDPATALALKLVERAEPADPDDAQSASARENGVKAVGKDFLLEQIARGLDDRTGPAGERADGGRGESLAVETLSTCPTETLAFDGPYWWAQRYLNNCYNYATNKKTNSFGQPGEASGNPIQFVDCADVSRAALSDGAHWANDCFGAEESPRLYVALVIWPQVDYHWYRKHPDFWGHKMGVKPASFYDDLGVVISNPETCYRGNYEDFCGYMIIPNSIVVT